jgi:antitoxin FitA
MPMANLQIKNVPEELHDELRRRAAREGRTVRDYLLDLIREDQRVPTMREWVEGNRAMDPVELDAAAYALLQRHDARRDAG